MLAEYVGLLLLVSLVLLQCFLLARRLAAARRAPDRSCATRRVEALRYRSHALLLLVGLVAIALGLPVAASFDRTGLDGLTALTLFVLPVSLGIAMAARRGRMP